MCIAAHLDSVVTGFDITERIDTVGMYSMSGIGVNQSTGFVIKIYFGILDSGKTVVTIFGILPFAGNAGVVDTPAELTNGFAVYAAILINCFTEVPWVEPAEFVAHQAICFGDVVMERAF